MKIPDEYEERLSQTYGDSYPTELQEIEREANELNIEREVEDE